MSAFVVEDQVINSVLNFLMTARKYGSFEYHDLLGTELMVNMDDPKEVSDLGESMFKLNCYAVEQRYGEGQAKDFRELNYKFKRSAAVVTPMQAYKSLGCFLYQCAEGDVPGDSGLYAALQRVHAAIAHNIVQALPAYDKAAW